MIHRKKIKSKKKDTGYWKSYSDMMAALLLVFILIVTMALGKVAEQNRTIEESLGVKRELIEDLDNALSGYVTVDPGTGDIRFKSDILFAYNKDELMPNGKAFLNDFIPRYLDVILSDKYIDKIAEVIIEGHTDTDGGYTFNLQLSQARALSVAKFVVGENSSLVSQERLERLRKMVTATGKSYMHPIYFDESNSVIDAEKSRRVELKFRLKDDETIKTIGELIN